MDAKRIGLRIQEVRMQRGLTQAALAQMLDITPKYMSNIECGDKIPNRLSDTLPEIPPLSSISRAVKSS